MATSLFSKNEKILNRNAETYLGLVKHLRWKETPVEHT